MLDYTEGQEGSWQFSVSMLLVYHIRRETEDEQARSLFKHIQNAQLYIEWSPPLEILGTHHAKGARRTDLEAVV